MKMHVVLCDILDYSTMLLIFRTKSCILLSFKGTYLLKMESPIENINCNEISEGLNDDGIKSLEIKDETSLLSR